MPLACDGCSWRAGLADDFLPYGRQALASEDIEAVLAVLTGDFLTTGPAVPALEAALADATGSRYVAACSSGTAALHLANLATGIGRGDTVIVPSITFLATASAVELVGASVRFADVDPDTGLMTAETLRASVDGSPDLPKAAYAVHLGGQAADMDALGDVADEHGFELLEDASHALGSEITDRLGDRHRIGSSGRSRLATFSFHPVKTITTGEGGAVATGDEDIHERILRLRNHGMTRNSAMFVDPDLSFDADGVPCPWAYEMHRPGLNYRMSDIHAALGRSQIARLAAIIEKRRKLVRVYRELLAPLGNAVRPVREMPNQNPAWHLLQVLIEFDELGVSRGATMSRLRRAGIGTQVHYIPVHRQPYYREREEVNLPGAESFFRRTLSLPLHMNMNTEDVARVVATLASVLHLD